MALLSKIKIGEVIYDLKDAQARADLKTLLGEHAVEELGAAAWKAVATQVADNSEGLVSAASVKSYVDAQVGSINKFDVKVVDSLPVNPGEDEMFIIYLMPHEHGASDVYDEYILVRSGDTGAYTYKFEKIGNTDIDLSGKVDKTATIAGITLDHNITAEELKTALGLGKLAYRDSANGTVAGQTISGVKATGTSAGELEGALAYDSTAVASTGSFTPVGTIAGTVVATGTIEATQTSADTAAVLTKGDYTPEGSVRVIPTTGTVKAIQSVGSKSSFTEGKFTAATLNKTDGTFATEGVVASIDDTDSEMLVLTAAGTGSASLVNSFDGGSKAADTFVAGDLPVAEEADIVTGITSATFTGTTAADALVTGVTYSKAGAIKATFTGNDKGDAIKAAFTGTAGEVAVSGNYDKANLGTVAFKGGETTLNVGDINVAAKDVTVE